MCMQVYCKMTSGPGVLSYANSDNLHCENTLTGVERGFTDTCTLETTTHAP